MRLQRAGAGQLLTVKRNSDCDQKKNGARGSVIRITKNGMPLFAVITIAVIAVTTIIAITAIVAVTVVAPVTAIVRVRAVAPVAVIDRHNGAAAERCDQDTNDQCDH